MIKNLKELELVRERLLKIAVPVLEKTLIKELLDEGTLLRKDLIKSYVLLNFDEIHSYIQKYSYNTAVTLEVMIDSPDDNLISLFNIKQWCEDIYNNIPDEQWEGIERSNKIFSKFYQSFVWYTEPTLFARAIIENKIRNAEDFKRVFHV